MFDLITQQALQTKHFHEKTEAVMPDFLIKRMITLVYAKGGMGKSWLAMAVARHCATEGMSVIYLDYDNPLSVLKDRGVPEKLISPFDDLHYIQRSSATMTAINMVSAMEEQGRYDNTLIIVDSLRNLGNMNNDNYALAVMDRFMNLREAGATILILSHANKDGRNYQGSNNIYNSLDNMYQLSNGESAEGQITFLLELEKDRGCVKDQAYCFDANTLRMTPLDIEQARLSAEDKAFIDQVKAVLTERSGISKTELLDACGYNKTNKTAREKLEKFEGEHWVSEKTGKSCAYKIRQ